MGYPSYLSVRLKAVAELVSDGRCLADIGTDHAYIPIWLVKSGRISGAIAADVNRGPLQRALEHIRDNGLEDRIKLRLSDGFLALKPGEADSAVLAGMGGGLMIRILKEGARVVEHLEECILQPQSEIEKVRAFLLEEGFLFVREDMVEEEGKFYPMMKVIPPGQPNNRSEKCIKTWNETELRYGKLLLEERNQVLYDFLLREIRIKRGILSSLENNGSERAGQRRDEIRKELAYAQKGVAYYAL